MPTYVCTYLCSPTREWNATVRPDSTYPILSHPSSPFRSSPSFLVWSWVQGEDEVNQREQMHVATRISTAHSRMITLSYHTTTIDTIDVDEAPAQASAPGRSVYLHLYACTWVRIGLVCARYPLDVPSI